MQTTTPIRQGLLAICILLLTLAAQGDESAVTKTKVTYLAHQHLEKAAQFIKENNFKEGVSHLRAAAKLGHPYAYSSLAKMYMEGIGLGKNTILARKYYLKAANKNVLDAFDALGVIYRDGIGITQNDNKAIQYFQKGAQFGDANAQNNLGAILTQEKYRKKYARTGYLWTLKAAKQGHAIAMSNLSGMYILGIGVEKDDIEGVKWTMLAAKRQDDYSVKQLEEMKKQYSADIINKAIDRARQFKPVKETPPDVIEVLPPQKNESLATAQNLVV